MSTKAGAGLVCLHSNVVNKINKGKSKMLVK